MNNENGNIEVNVSPNHRKAWLAAAAAGSGVIALIASVAPGARGEEVPCDPEMDVCVPGITAAPDEEYVPGNPVPGDTIPIDPEFDDKGENVTTTTTEPETTTTTTTEPETTTTTTTEPETTTTTTTEPETTTTTTTEPETTTTTVVVTTVPPTLPPITVTVPVTPEHTN